MILHCAGDAGNLFSQFNVGELLYADFLLWPGIDPGLCCPDGIRAAGQRASAFQ